MEAAILGVTHDDFNDFILGSAGILSGLIVRLV
jgi:hypothetical protein